MTMARRLGVALAERQYELVYGGADVGLMGEVADTVMKAGGVVRGIIPASFADKVSHQGLTELRVVPSMHDRKKMMFDFSDAFIALPGGYGTLEEVAEVLTWAQLGLHAKPCGVINVEGYFDPLLAFLDNAVAKGFMKTQHRQMLLVVEDPLDLLNQMATYKVNALGTLRLLEAVRQLQLKCRVILISSADVYGRSNVGRPLTEDLPSQPLSPYALSKHMTGEAGLFYHRACSRSIS
jgi:uncharacterized protein (TIGR00730 family)